MTPDQIMRVDIPTLNARANDLLDLLSRGLATDAEEMEFDRINQEFDRRFDTALDLARVREGQ